MVAAGAELVEVSCPHFVHALATYYLILPAEASSNLAKFDAMRYGLRVLPEGVDDPSAEEVMRATREAGFGDEVKRRIILGTYALSSGYYDAFYGKAQKVRTLISRDFDAGLHPRRRAALADGADDGVRAGREARRPARDVPQRPRHHPGQPVGRPRHLGAQRPGRRGRPARRRPDPGAGDGRRPGLLRRRGPRGRAAGEVGRADARQARGLDKLDRRRRRRPHDRDPAVVRRGAGALRPGAGPGGPRRAEHRVEDVLRLPDGVRRRAQHPGLPDLPGPAGRDAGGQRGRRRVGHPDRAGAQLRDRRVVPLRPEELLLPGHAEELPDLPVRRADRLQRLHGRAGRGRRRSRDGPRRDRARPHGGGHRQVPARRRRHRPHPRRRLLAGRLQPGRHPAHRDRHQADPRHPRAGAAGRQGVRRPAARPAPRPRRQRRADGAGLAALRRQPVAGPRDTAPSRAAPARHPHRDQERQLAALGRAGRPLRDAAARRRARSPAGRSSRRPGTGTRTPA